MGLFRPADSPTWLRQFSDSIERLFKEKLARPLWLWGAATTGLPTTPEMGANEGALAYDDTLNSLTVYTGAAWSPVSLVGHTHTASAIANVPAGTIAATNVQAALNELDTEKIATSVLDTDGALAANSDAKIATQKATKTYVDQAVTGLLDFKGSTNCSANPNYPAASKGDAYVVSVAGKIGGASGKSVDVSDVYVASADNAGGTEASVGTSWFVLEHNLQGALLAANNLSDLASAATARTNLGLAIGTNVPAWDADLDAVASSGLAAAWQSWTPTWTNLTIGNGTVVAKYMQVGKLVFVRLSLVFGSTTSISGDVSFTNPVNRATYAGTGNVTSLGRARSYDLSADTAFELDVHNFTAGASKLRAFIASGSYFSTAGLSSTVPFTWATGDEIAAQFFYEAA